GGAAAGGGGEWAARGSPRQERRPSRTRSRLVSTTSSRRSQASVPRPSQSGTYGDRNGTNASIRSTGTYRSMTTTETCSTSSDTLISDRLRCSPSVTNRGQRGEATRPAVSRPSTTVAVNRTSRTKPLLRDRYHNVLLPISCAATGRFAALMPGPRRHRGAGGALLRRDSRRHPLRCRRPAGDGVNGPVRGDQPGGQRTGGQPVRGR